MIHEVEGDILLSSAASIAQGLAPNDDFKKGLAFSLKERWPKLYKDFRQFSHNNHPKEGTIWAWQDEVGKTIFNLFTQEHAPGRGSIPGKAKTSYVNHCLKDLRKQLIDNPVESLAIPKLATGVGGLSWDEVRPLIDTHLADLGIPIFIYTYKKDIKAEE